MRPELFGFIHTRHATLGDLAHEADATAEFELGLVHGCAKKKRGRSLDDRQPGGEP